MNHGFRRTTSLVCTTALLWLSTSFGSPRAQAPAPAAAQHPSAPPPGSPAPGSRCLGCGTAPEPIDDSDHTGWRQIFDGKTLTNWDGNPDVWKVEDGAITAEHWPERRVGTTYIIWRGGEPGDFELKLEVKADYDVHGGIFYRSIVGAAPATPAGAGSGTRGAPSAAATSPRPQPAPLAVPSDPRWNVRGYALDWDYDPGNNGNIQDPGAGRTDTQIVWRGHIVRTNNGKRPRSIGTLGDRDALMLTERATSPGTMWPGDIVQALASVMPPETIVSTDVGSHKYLFGQYWPSRKPETFWMSNGLSGMAYGLSAAIGAKLARPDAPVLAAVGDGGFSMNAQELETAERVGAPFITLVLEDGSFSLIKISQAGKKLPSYRTEFGRIDTVKMAEACGVRGLRTANPDQLASAAKEACDERRSLVIAVPVNDADYTRMF